MSDTKLAAQVLEALHLIESEMPKLKSPHEGYAYILEAVQLLWTTIIHEELEESAKAATALAALAIRFLKDLYVHT